MGSALNALSKFNTESLLTGAVLAILGGTVLFFASAICRGAIQRLHDRRFDALSIKIHKQWRDIVRGNIAGDEWRRNPVQREIVQSIVIQEIGATTDKDRAGLQEFLRSSGLVENCVRKVTAGHGWNRRRAMLALGAMRVPEAIAPLAEALSDWQLNTRMAALQALGQTGLVDAGHPIIESFLVGALKVPLDSITNALVRCFAGQPEALLAHLRGCSGRAQGESRELIARVASELATPSMADEMIFLAADPRPEVRAAAAKALAVAPLALAIPSLGDLVRDEVWFVRLRAVSSLNQIRHLRTVPILLEAVRDSNRLVRMRAASALAKFEQDTVEILQNVVDSRDRYALHAMISALELGGGFERVMAELADPLLHDRAASQLLAILRESSASLWTLRPVDPVVESVFP